MKRWYWAVTIPAIAAATLIAWAAFAPVRTLSREKIFEIPQGTWARRMAGSREEILPDHIRLTAKLQDVLVLKNRDDVPQIFGPTLMMPGQSLRLPFAQPSEYQFACTAHVSGQMTIIVGSYPGTPWDKALWRARRALDGIREL